MTIQIRITKYKRLKRIKERIHGRKNHKETITCNSTDNFLSPIPVSDWLIFCGVNWILYQ